MKESATVTTDKGILIYTVPNGTYLDNGKLHITNNGQQNAIVFYLIMGAEKHSTPVWHRELIEPSKAIIVDLESKLDSGTVIFIRTSSFNIFAKVEGAEVPFGQTIIVTPGPLAHIKSIEPNCLTTLYIVKQETQVFAKKLCIANKDESGEPILFSIVIKSVNDTLENKHFHTYNEQFYPNTISSINLDMILDGDFEIMVKSNSSNVEVFLEGEVLS